MADTPTTKDRDNPNQTMRSEQAKAEVSGGDRQREYSGMNESRDEKNAIGGQSPSDATSQDESREFAKSRSEASSQR